ncbi:MAG TPA: RsmG family class I SAM-dependent methyltransferase, partial [Pyrinomonadaceae bacterium]|nr:RsmG family class I SAM-dependent methyltransferase [Pyrinomonadaceae bacterium]
MPTPLAEFRESLKSRAPEFGINLQPAQIELLTNYYELVRKWNPRLHLVAPCSPAEFAGRHVLESLVLLKP